MAMATMGQHQTQYKWDRIGMITSPPSPIRYRTLNHTHFGCWPQVSFCPEGIPPPAGYHEWSHESPRYTMHSEVLELGGTLQGDQLLGVAERRQRVAS